MAVKLIYKHQQKTYEIMKEALEKKGKAAYVFPTGCGKSFPALKYVEEKPDKKVTIFAPNLAIKNQYEKYIKQYLENGKERLKSGNIEITTYQQIYSTRKDKLKKYSQVTKAGRVIKFSKKLKSFKSIKKSFDIDSDIVILDEIHRIGAEKWEEAIDRIISENPNRKTIGMSATPERTDGRNMAYEKFGDDVVYEMSLTEALSGEKEGEVVLKTPRYVRVLSQLKPILREYEKQIDLIDDEERRKNVLKKFEKLNTIVSRSPDIQDVMLEGMKKKNGKYIVFCKDREDMLEKMAEADQIFGKVNTKINKSYVLSRRGKDDTVGKTAAQNRKTLKNFEDKKDGEELNLLFCVDMLNEGIHIPDVDGEVLFDLTSSPILYKQRIGRVLSSDKDAGETVIIDAVNNWLEQIDTYYELEKAINKGNQTDRDENDLLRLSSDETNLLDIMREINEELKYGNKQLQFEQLIEWLEEHKGIMPRKTITVNRKVIPLKQLNEDQKFEVRLANYWTKTKEKVVLEEYIGRPIHEVPEEYREKIAKLRSFGLGLKKKTVYEQIIEWLETHDGKMPRTDIIVNSKQLRKSDMTVEENEEVRLYRRWYFSEERKILNEYIGEEIEEVPEEYREKIAVLRGYGLGVEKNKQKNIYNDIIKWLSEHDGNLPRAAITVDQKSIKRSEMTKEERDETRLYKRWGKSTIKEILEEYTGKPIEEVPEKYREKVKVLREYGLGLKEKNAYKEVLQWLETHDGNMPRGSLRRKGRKLKTEEFTEEELEEVRLYARWKKTKQKKALFKYVGKPIEEVPEDVREDVRILRGYGLGLKEKTVYEQVIEWIETHDGIAPRGTIRKNSKALRKDELTEEQLEEKRLYSRWFESKEKKVLDEYEGRPIEEVPKKFREKIATLREYGLGIQEKSAYEQIVEWLETHDGKMPRSAICIKGKFLAVEEMTEDERKEKKLYGRWRIAQENKILEEYAGRPIEEVPEEYREKIAKLRSLGQTGMKKDKKIANRMKNSVGKKVKNNEETRNEIQSEKVEVKNQNIADEK